MSTRKLGTLGAIFAVALLSASLADARGRHGFPPIKVTVENTPGVTIENDTPIPVTIQDGGTHGSAQPFVDCLRSLHPEPSPVRWV